MKTEKTIALFTDYDDRTKNKLWKIVEVPGYTGKVLTSKPKENRYKYSFKDYAIQRNGNAFIITDQQTGCSIAQKKTKKRM